MRKRQGSRVKGQAAWVVILCVLCVLSRQNVFALQKNAASQVICAELISRNDGSIVPTGTTDVYVLGDGGTQAAGAGVVIYEGQGLWCYAPTQAETNYNHVAYTFANSAAVAITVQTYPGDGWAVALPGTFPDGTAGAIIGAIPGGVTVTPAQITAGVLSNTVTIGSKVLWKRGDADRFTVGVGAAYAKSGGRYYLAVKASRTADNSTAIINREITITDAATVAGYIDLVSTETQTIGSYYAEIERRDADGTSNPKTCWQALFEITQDVRQ